MTASGTVGYRMQGKMCYCYPKTKEEERVREVVKVAEFEYLCTTLSAYRLILSSVFSVLTPSISTF